MENQDCEFCNEFRTNNVTTFSRLYNDAIVDRTLLESRSFKVIPTLGQLFDYSMLVIPKNHFETMSALSLPELTELTGVYKQVSSRLSKLGHVIGFEHGAQKITGGGCGIFHAHLHIIPLPEKVDLFKFFKHEYKIYSSLESALQNSNGSKEYLIAINEDETVGYLDLTKMPGTYPSQYFRKALCKRFNLPMPWDWKEYNYVENRIMGAVRENVLQ